jgi:hypothetical protein
VSLLDRGKRTPGVEPPDDDGPPPPHRPSEKPLEVAAAIAQSERPRTAGNADEQSPAAHGFLRATPKNDQTSASTAKAEARSPLARTGYALLWFLACVVVSAAIGSTGSSTVGAIAFAVVSASALSFMLGRPRALRAVYARFPSSVTALHVAILIGALATWDTMQYQLRALRLEVSARSAERALAAAKEEKRATLVAQAGNTSQQLRALAAQARKAVSNKNWQGVATILNQAVAIQRPYKEGDAVVVLDRDALKELESVATSAADAQHSDQALKADAKLRALLAKAEADQAAGQQAEASQALADARAVRQAHEVTANHYPLDPALTERLAALSAAERRRAASADTRRAATARVEALRRAWAQAEEFASAGRWADADRLLRALRDALRSVPPNVQAAWPADLDSKAFRAQVEKRAAEVRRAAEQAARPRR